MLACRGFVCRHFRPTSSSSWSAVSHLQVKQGQREAVCTVSAAPQKRMDAASCDVAWTQRFHWTLSPKSFKISAAPLLKVTPSCFPGSQGMLIKTENAIFLVIGSQWDTCKMLPSSWNTTWNVCIFCKIKTAKFCADFDESALKSFDDIILSCTLIISKHHTVINNTCCIYWYCNGWLASWVVVFFALIFLWLMMSCDCEGKSCFFFFFEVTLVLNHIWNDTVAKMSRVSSRGEFPVSASFILSQSCCAGLYAAHESEPHYCRDLQRFIHVWWLWFHVSSFCWLWQRRKHTSDEQQVATNARLTGFSWVKRSQMENSGDQVSLG